MAAAKFINDPADVPSQSLQGLLYSRPDLTLLAEAPNVVVPRAIEKGRVALICGGGSGHEPAHAGFVAEGWLTGAVCGGVFASPSQKSVHAAIRHVSAANGNAGVLVLIKNYGGDVINFTSAATVAANEVPHGATSTTNVDTYIIGDDVAFGADHDAQRGIAGTVLMYKMLGAAATDGASLSQLVDLAQTLGRSLRSIGSSLSSCAVPGNPPTGTIKNGEFELGLGIHGEAGMRSLPLEQSRPLVTRMLTCIGAPVASDPKTSKSLLPEGAKPAEWFAEGQTDAVAVFVNNLGATSDIEMNVVTADVVETLRGSKKADVARLVVGRAMTALDMHGFSITVLRLPRDAADKSKWLALLDAANPATVGAFAVSAPPPPLQLPAAHDDALEELQMLPAGSEHSARATFLVSSAKTIASALLAHEAALNGYDAEVGDGDLGSGASRAARAVISFVDVLTAKHGASAAPQPRAFIATLAEVVADAFAGTSGPLLGGFIAAASPCAEGSATAETVARAVRAGTDAVCNIGKASAGDRTMVDALLPVASAAEKTAPGDAANRALWGKLAAIAAEAAESASKLVARKGRARYSNGREVGKKEPGCELIVLMLAAIGDVAQA